MSSGTALIVGGSSGLGRALAECLAENGYSLALISRDQEDLFVMKASLETQYGRKVFVYPTDLLDPQLNAEQVVAQAFKDLGSLNYAYLIAGGSFDGDEKVPTTKAFKNSLRLNFESIALFANAVLNIEQPCRSILMVSSIAAVAPRSVNSSYSAAKTALESYAQSLRHHCYQAKIPTRIQVVRMGYMESGFTRGKKLLFPIAPPRQVANFILKRKDQDFGIQVFPKFWVLILFIISQLPWAIYKRMRF